MTDLRLYTNPMSRGRIARWMLEEVGQPYDVTVIQYGPDMKGPDYTSINPMGKVPTLIHKRQTITETAAICAYLAETFPEAGLKPGADQLGTYYRWLFFAAGPVEAATANEAMGFSPSDEQAQMSGYGTFETMYDTLVNAISKQDYLCGSQFTAADIYLGSQVGWGLQFGTLPGHPALEAYRDRLYARPAAVRATQLDDTLAA